MSDQNGRLDRSFSQPSGLFFERLEERHLLAADLRLLKDINQNLSSVSLLDHAEVGGITYLGARTSSGDALWKTDGTEIGTSIVREFGSDFSYLNHFTVVNRTLYFVVDSDVGKELWKSDGSSQGTVIVRDIVPGTDGSNPSYLTNVAGTLYFSATHPRTGRELWKSDGTAAGTVQVRDIVLGTGDSNPTNLTAVGSTLYFSARSGPSGTELFRSDGTSATTALVRDLLPGTASSNPSNLVNLGGTLYFSAFTSSTNNALWKTQGTPSSTVQVKGLQTATDTIRDAFVVGSRIYFSAAQSDNRELWVSDGTLSGTLVIKDILPGPAGSYPSGFVEFGGQLFFSAKGLAGRELWRSNGTSAGTFQVKDVYLGDQGSYPELLQRVGSTLYFVANNGSSGRELWKTNGTSAGTILVKDVYPGPIGAFRLAPQSSNIAAVNGKLLFVASAVAPESPSRVWISAGTESSTTMLNSIGKETADSNSLGGDPGFTNLNGVVYVVASSSGSGSRDLWKTNGTSAGTVLVKHFDGAGIRTADLLNMAGSLYFVAEDVEHGISLWKTNGSLAEPVLVHQNGTGTVVSGVEQLTVAGNALYFTDLNGGLWKSNGTKAGTSLVVRSFTEPRILFTIGSTVYLAATALSTGTELWKSDGTSAGTVLVKDINAGANSSLPSKAVKVGTKYYFTANDGSHGRELWSTEGTTATTVLVKDVVPGFDSSSITEMTAVGTTLYFANRTGLWKSNGSDESTVQFFGGTNEEPRNLVNVSGKLFFSAFAGPERGRELWRSDGTVLGTTVVKDIQPGPVGSEPTDLKNIGGRLYFAAYTSAYGIELWSSNGSFAGTVMEKDLNPRTFDSSPKYMIALEDQLILIANGANAGREVFAEPKSIIGPDGEGESLQSDGYFDYATAAPGLSQQRVDAALLAWNIGDETNPNRRVRMLPVRNRS